MFPSTRAKERMSSKIFLGWEGDSSAYKGFCPHSKNRESLYLSFCQSSL